MKKYVIIKKDEFFLKVSIYVILKIYYEYYYVLRMNEVKVEQSFLLS